VSTPTPTAAAAVQLRTVPISATLPIEGWNPRMAFDDAELQALSASMLERGCLVPVLVQATGDGAYRLVDGEKRYKAAVLAALMELPAIVRAVTPARTTRHWRASCSSTRSSLTSCVRSCRRLRRRWRAGG
jgi:ParB/RepB/Spo0J family partition protein